MAKRAPAGEVAYNPLDESLAQSVIRPVNTLRTSINSTLDIDEHERVTIGPSTISGVIPNRGFSRAKRVLLTPDEERHIERLVDRIAEQIGASLKLSHLLRACMALLCHSETEILRYANSLRLVRPANGDAVALAQFEQGIAKILSLALRDAPAMR